MCERCATVLAWATRVAVTSAFDVADPLRITLLPRAPPSRVRCWPLIRNPGTVFAHSAAVDGLNQTAVWVAAALLVLLMFSSYALGAAVLSPPHPRDEVGTTGICSF